MAVLDFEEQLGHGLGKNAVDVLKFRPWLCIVKKLDLRWKTSYPLPCDCKKVAIND